MKEFTEEGNRSASLIVELQGAGSTPLTHALVDCGGASAAISLLGQWMRSPHAFVDAVRHDLDCNSDHMVSKMEFRRWSKDGVLIALLNTIAPAGTATPTPPSESLAVFHTHACIPAATAAGGLVLAPAAAAPVCSSAPASQPPPPPDCPYVQWTAHKAVSTSAQADAGEKLVLLKGPAFSDHCEEFYQKWKLDPRASRARLIAGCEDTSAEINYVTMEIQGKSIGSWSKSCLPPLLPQADLQAGCLLLHRIPPASMQTQIGCTMAPTSSNEMVSFYADAAACPEAHAQLRSSKA